ncbi:MAG: ribonuclease HI [Bacteroidales bacterium]|nr:ribonuclease HI [Bacteroidales bacterium]
MKLLTFEMEIINEQDGYFVHSVLHQGKQTEFKFNPQTASFKIDPTGELSEIINRNQDQLMKILKTKKTATFYPGFRLGFVITDGKDVDIFNDMNKIVIVNRTTGEDEINVVESGKTAIHQVFTDACYLEKTGRSGIAAIIKFPDDNYRLYSTGSKAKNNCHAELEAVVAGLELLKDVDEIRLISDSRYVRKGLTEWMHNWKLNNWKTSNGNNAKNVETWKKIDELTRGKYLEVAWVKGHSGHFENTMCDLYARDAAGKK